MQSLNRGFQQFLVVVLTASLISATTPPPSRATFEDSDSAPLSLRLPPPPSKQRHAFAALASLTMNPAAGNPREASGAERAEATLHDPGTEPIAKLSRPGHTKIRHARPLAFIENKGQFDNQVKFRAGDNGQTVWLTNSGLVFDFLRPKSNQATALPPEARPRKPNANDLPILESQQIQQPAVRDLEQRVIYQDFVGANLNSGLETKGVQPGAYNYLSGSDPSKWQTQVRSFSEIVYHDIWNGVDLRLSGNGPDLEQEFVIKPGAKVSDVRLSYKGIDKLEVDKDGSLLIRTADGRMRETPPRLYQEIGGRRVVVKGCFKLLSPTSYTFDVSAYKSRYALVIDPTLLYSTFLGGSAGNDIFGTGTHETATGIAVDQAGNAYVTGFTGSADFPTTPGAFQTTDSGGQQTFVTKLNPAGSALIYSTYLSASFPRAIAVDPSGKVYVAGSNTHADFATTANAYSQSCSAPGGVPFLTVLNPSGTGLLYSTCIGSFVPNVGGVPVVTSMTADAAGRAYLAGYAGGGSTLPTTPTAYQPAYPPFANVGTSGFVTVFDTTGSGTSSLVYSTYLGPISAPTASVPGGAGDIVNAIAVDNFGKIYVAGDTFDAFPVTPGAYQTVFPPCIPNGSLCPPSGAAFIAKLDPTASGPQSLIYATYFGGVGGTAANAIAVDSSGAAYITGSTSGSHFSSFPITLGAFQSTAGGTITASFVTKLNAAGSQLVYSTFVSDLRSSSGNSIAVDSLGNAYVTGQVNGSTFPVTADAFQSTYVKPGCSTDCASAFLAKLNAAGSDLVYSSYIGGSGDDVATAIAVDQSGAPYIVGHTSSSDFPTTGGSFQTAMKGTGDAFVLKFSSLGLSQSFQLFPTSGGNTGSVTLTIAGTFAQGSSIALSCAGNPSIAGQNVDVEPNLHTLSATFNLVGVNAGTCDVAITSPGGSSGTLHGAFTVKQGGGPQLWVNVIGSSTIRVQFPQTYFIGYGNYGNVDALGVHLLIYVPSALAPSLNLGNVSGVSTTIIQDGTAIVAINLGRVPANSTGLAPISLTAFDSSQPSFQIRANISGH